MPGRRAQRLRRFACIAFSTLPVAAAAAHDFKITTVNANLKSDGAYEITMIVDVDSLAVGAPQSADSAVVAAALRAMTSDELATAADQARATIIRRVRIRFDSAKSDPDVSFPEHGLPETTRRNPPTFLGTTAFLRGPIPPDAAEFTFGASRAFPAVNLTITDESTGAIVKYTLGASEDSPPFAIGVAPPPTPAAAVALRYLALGFEHIVPKGLDHILFVLGLFLLSPQLRPLVWQITAFTIAHSVTLALSIYGILSLPPEIVEPLIAASITCIAVENVLTTKLHPWRPAVVFLFGLLHGLGFAGVLRELGLPREQFVTAVLTFNVGVELGQLTVVALAFAAVGWFRMQKRYRKTVVIPASTFIAAVGLYWTIKRLM